MWIEQGNTGNAEKRRIRNLIRENHRLLIGCHGAVVQNQNGGLLRREPVGDHGIAVVEAVEILVEDAKPAADNGFCEGIPGKTKARGNALELVGKLAGQGESGILLWLRIDLKILAQAEIQGEAWKDPPSVLDVEANIRNAKGKFGAAAALRKRIVSTESEVDRVG